MLNVTVITSYIFSVLCFLLFLYLVFTQPRTSSPSRQRELSGMADVEIQGEVEDFAKLIEALAKLTDSFAKAGPMVMALVSSIFFLLIAVVGSGFGSAVAAITP